MGIIFCLVSAMQGSRTPQRKFFFSFTLQVDFHFRRRRLQRVAPLAGVSKPNNRITVFLPCQCNVILKDDRDVSLFSFALYVDVRFLRRPHKEINTYWSLTKHHCVIIIFLVSVIMGFSRTMQTPISFHFPCTLTFVFTLARNLTLAFPRHHLRRYRQKASDSTSDAPCLSCAAKCSIDCRLARVAIYSNRRLPSPLSPREVRQSSTSW